MKWLRKILGSPEDRLQIRLDNRCKQYNKSVDIVLDVNTILERRGDLPLTQQVLYFMCNKPNVTYDAKTIARMLNKTTTDVRNAIQGLLRTGLIENYEDGYRVWINDGFKSILRKLVKMLNDIDETLNGGV